MLSLFLKKTFSIIVFKIYSCGLKMMGFHWLQDLQGEEQFIWHYFCNRNMFDIWINVMDWMYMSLHNLNVESLTPNVAVWEGAYEEEIKLKQVHMDGVSNQIQLVLS